MKASQTCALALAGAALLAAASPSDSTASDRDLRIELSGRYDGRGRLSLGGESIYGDAYIIMPRRVGAITGRIDPGGIGQSIKGRVNRIRCRRNVIVYFGKLRIQKGPISVTGKFRAKARRRAGANTLSLPIYLKRDVLIDTIHVTGRFKGKQLQ
ncbi:MAG: hypothetical protein CMO55_02275 [Verrucomicrobiales bacterium]|nr:hypothetical protein [Verrucomicrobiales bacterium]